MLSSRASPRVGDKNLRPAQGTVSHYSSLIPHPLSSSADSLFGFRPPTLSLPQHLISSSFSLFISFSPDLSSISCFLSLADFSLDLFHHYFSVNNFFHLASLPRLRSAFSAAPRSAPHQYLTHFSLFLLIRPLHTTFSPLYCHPHPQSQHLNKQVASNYIVQGVRTATIQAPTLQGRRGF